MWEIIGILLLIIGIVMAIGFADEIFSYFEDCLNSRKQKKINRNYENEKAKSVYNAAEKSMKLDMMQMDAFREMEEKADEYRNYPYGGYYDD